MKTYFFTLLMFLSSYSFSQKINDEIWGCKFGSSKEDLINVIKLQGYSPVISERKIVIKDPEFSGNYFTRAVFNLYLNQFYSCEFQYNATDNMYIKDLYIQLKSRLIKKYGYREELTKENSKTIHFSDSKNQIILTYDKIQENFFILSLCYTNIDLLKKYVNEL
jgi:hypothetical protein